MKKPQHTQRLNHDFQADQKGRLFFDKLTFTDLSQVNILRCGVDTVRQLYRGFLKSEINTMIEESGGVVSFGGYDWVANRSGRDSGYQFKLQNSDLGLILLIKNYNVKNTVHGPHLKIEVSPHLIEQKSPCQLQGMIDDLANQILDDLDYNQAAVHLAIDVQGWEPPTDIVSRLHCRSRAVRQFDGVDTVDFAGLACTYGRGETYMFGSASGMQLCIYNKTKQAKATDKLDYWRNVWTLTDNPFDDTDSGNYDDTAPVWRIEFRFHHSVVQQFSDGSTFRGKSCPFYSFSALAQHLDGLLQYGFDAFKLLDSPAFYSPIWSLLAQDTKVSVSSMSLLHETDYRRYYKTSSGFSGKNVELMLGNAISLAARERLDAVTTIKALKSLPFWPTIRDHYQDKGITETDLKEHIAKLLQERYLRWGKAV